MVTSAQFDTPIASILETIPIFWFQSLTFIFFCSSTGCHFLAVPIPTCHYHCLLLPPSVDVEAGYCQHWLPGVQEMPWKRLSQIWPVQDWKLLPWIQNMLKMWYQQCPVRWPPAARERRQQKWEKGGTSREERRGTQSAYQCYELQIINLHSSVVDNYLYIRGIMLVYSLNIYLSGT